MTASFVSSLDNTASIACVRFRARSPNLRPLLLSFSPLFPLYNAPFLSIILSARLGAHSADLAAQSGALIIPQRTPIGSLDNTAARLASPSPQTRSLKTSHLAHALHSPRSYRIIYLSILKSRSGTRSLHLADRISALGSVISLCRFLFASFQYPDLLLYVRDQCRKSTAFGSRFDSIGASDRVSLTDTMINIVPALPQANSPDPCVFAMLALYLTDEHTYAGTCHFTEQNV